MNISQNVVNKYLLICHQSSAKCKSFFEIEDKIIRAVTLGKTTVRTKEAREVGYHNLSFIVRGNKVVNMWKNNNGTKYVNVSERIKSKYDSIHSKIVV